jgi:xylose isomerase
MVSMPGRYAARLNAFKIGAEAYWPGRNRITAVDLVERAATVPGLDAVDLNYPDHLADFGPREFKARLGDLGLALNGFAMRYYSEPAFKRGAFTNADPAVRRRAIDLTKRGVDALQEMGGTLMTLWLGEDGFDVPFQADYARLWDDEIAAIREVAGHAPGIDVAIEYKPNEPRAFALLADIGTTLLAVRDAGAPNLGVTLDFAHVLYADEMPAMAATLAARQSRLLGVHLNDGYGKRDDGLMAGAVHTVQTVELLHVLKRIGYDRVIYFDTFPDISGLDPVAEATANIETVEALFRVVDRLAGSTALEAATAAQDAVAAHRIVQRAILGGAG